MGRRPTRLDLTAQEKADLTHHLKTISDSRASERLQFVINASRGKHTLEDLAKLAHRSRSTIQNWLKKFEIGGLTGLLARQGGLGKPTRLADIKIQTELRAGIESGRLKTAAQIAAWLSNNHAIKRSRKSIYYWLRKNEANFRAKR